MKSYGLIFFCLLLNLILSLGAICSPNENLFLANFNNINIKYQESTSTFDSLLTDKVYYGMASFYSKSLEGTKTSNDEIFSHKKLTCASNRFKLGTWLRVTNLSNEKSIIVRVNDRMHPKMDKKGRIVDLSYLGAKKLAFINKGVTKVKVEVVEKGTID